LPTRLLLLSCASEVGHAQVAELLSYKPAAAAVIAAAAAFAKK
jgi:hypothetical protein